MASADVCSPAAQRVIDACERNWEAHKNDCSGFVRAVAADLGILLTGLANDIVDEIEEEDPWIDILNGQDAALKAEQGWFVVAGLRGSDQAVPSAHGHVVVVVAGPLAHGQYPTGYWGKLHGVGRKNTTINWAWRHADLENVVYAGQPL